MNEVIETGLIALTEPEEDEVVLIDMTENVVALISEKDAVV